MTGPFDVTLKHLIEAHPADWLPLVGQPRTLPVSVIDADLATVAASADKVIRVGAPTPWLLHIEMQSSAEPDLADRLHWYNALMTYRHRLPVRTLLVLLHPRANSPRLDGTYRLTLPDQETPYLTFHYEVVRLWQRPLDEFLGGGLGLLPLGTLADVPEEALPGVVRQVQGLIEATASVDERPTLQMATLILAGLRLERETLELLEQEIRRMKESITYQMILQEGLEQGLQQGLEQGLQRGLQQGLEQGQRDYASRLLRELAEEQFGAPPEAARQALEAITDAARLDRMVRRVHRVASWDELLRVL